MVFTKRWAGLGAAGRGLAGRALAVLAPVGGRRVRARPLAVVRAAAARLAARVVESPRAPVAVH